MLAQIRFIWAFSQDNLAGISEQICIISKRRTYEAYTKSYISHVDSIINIY